MFKEAEKGDKEINVLRTEQALEVRPDIIATACPFCNTMMTDGVKTKEKEKPKFLGFFQNILKNFKKQK